MFLKNGEGVDRLCAYGWAGQALHYIYGFLHLDFPSKKSSLQKIFGSNLTLHAREARGVPANHWFSVAAATENQSKTDLVSCLVSIYNAARTYFSTNAD